MTVSLKQHVKISHPSVQSCCSCSCVIILTADLITQVSLLCKWHILLRDNCQFLSYLGFIVLFLQSVLLSDFKYAVKYPIICIAPCQYVNVSEMKKEPFCNYLLIAQNFPLRFLRVKGLVEHWRRLLMSASDLWDEAATRCSVLVITAKTPTWSLITGETTTCRLTRQQPLDK